jgi:hypothetical protein
MRISYSVCLSVWVVGMVILAGAMVKDVEVCWRLLAVCVRCRVSCCVMEVWVVGGKELCSWL